MDLIWVSKALIKIVGSFAACLFLLILPSPLLLIYVLIYVDPYISDDLGIFLGIYLIFAIIMMWIVYPLRSRWAFYEKDDYRSLVDEFRFLKTVIIISFFIAVATYIFQIVVNELKYPTLLANSSPPIQVVVNELGYFRTHSTPLIPLLFILYSALFKFLSLFLRSDFRFYLAKGYANIAQSRSSDVEKLRDLRLSLKSYDQYLRKRLDLTIKDLSLIFSKLFVIRDRKKYEKIELFKSSFENEKLGPLDFLVSLMGVENPEQILTGEIIKPISEKFKENGVWLATIIPVIILVLQQFAIK